MQELLERGILHCSIAQRITKFCMFQVERKALSFCLSLFRLGSGPSSFQKVDENFNSCHKEVKLVDCNLFRRRLNNDRVQGRVFDTKRYSLFLLPNLGFVINLKKSVLDPCHVLEFLRSEIDSLNMRVELPKEKIKKQGQSLVSLEKVSRRDLERLTGTLSSMAMAVLPAPLQYKGLQQQQITGLSIRDAYGETIVLHKEEK